MSLIVTFACGHTQPATGAETNLVCQCGETRIQAVDAPLPTFRGHVRGPHAQFEALEPKPVTFVTQEEIENTDG